MAMADPSAPIAVVVTIVIVVVLQLDEDARPMSKRDQQTAAVTS